MHFVVPDGIDDPARPSGGNTYDRNLCRELGASGWSVHEHPVPGFWSQPDATALAALEDAVRRDPRRRPRPARRAPRLAGSRGAGGARGPAAPGRPRAHAARPRPPARPTARPGRGRAPRSQPPTQSSRPARGARRPAGRAVRAARRAPARRRARRRSRPSSHPAPPTGEALLCVAAVIPDEGPRRAARGARDDPRPALAVRLRGQPGPRPGLRRGSAPARARARAGRTACASGGTATGADLDRALRRGGPDGAGLARARPTAWS